MTSRNWVVNLGKKNQPCGCGKNCGHTKACKKFTADAKKVTDRENRKLTQK